MSPQNYPSRTAALREQQLMAEIDGWVHGLGKKKEKARGKQLEVTNSSNGWRYQGMEVSRGAEGKRIESEME